MNIKNIERIFSEDEATPSFIILAHYYFEKKYYKNADKICRIGLRHHPNNLEGQYIYAKLKLLCGATKEAEQILKNIVKKNVYSIQPVLLLIKIMQSLDRSHKSIITFILLANTHFADHPVVKKYYDKYCTNNNEIPEPKNKNLKKTEQHKTSQAKELDFNEKLATKTMYNLLLLQKEYNSAKSILLLMKKLKNNSDFVNKEMKNINQLINGEN